jgi:hypothetical protein
VTASIDLVAAWRAATDPTDVHVAAAAMADEIERLRAQVAKMRDALERTCEDTDWCPLCEHHPSHGHHDTCLLKEPSP